MRYLSFIGFVETMALRYIITNNIVGKVQSKSCTNFMSREDLQRVDANGNPE